MMREIFAAALLSLLLILPIPATAGERLRIVVPALPNTIKMYEEFTSGQSISVKEITSINEQCCSRPFASLIIIQQALALGGLPVGFEFMLVPNTARMRMAVERGDAVIAAQDLFSTAFTDNVYMSTAVIPEGSFIKGIYTSPGNGPMAEVHTLDSLRRFRAVSASHWLVDWETLERMDLAELRSVPRANLMFAYVNQGKADFTIMEFPRNEDLSRSMEGITLVPVPGIKIALKDSRHFMVSKNHPDGKRVFEALQAGLAIMKKQGRIKRYYTEVGFYNEGVKDWKLLNP